MKVPMRMQLCKGSCRHIQRVNVFKMMNYQLLNMTTVIVMATISTMIMRMAYWMRIHIQGGQ